ncbi:MAG: HAD family hydrolase [Albidovulum sp.]
MQDIRGLIFDKDGTLFDFTATWGGWAHRLLTELSEGSAAHAEKLARSIGFDLDVQRFAADSPVIAQTAPEIADCMMPHLPGVCHTDLVDRMNTLAASTSLAPAVALVPLFEKFRAMDLALGLATNDAEAPARAHLNQAGITGFFDFISGFDSGYGHKPEPGPLLAFAHQVGIAPHQIAMVGDSCHDLVAGRAAGMRTVAVLTGVADAEELAPYADVVMQDIGHLPGWITAGACVKT